MQHTHSFRETHVLHELKHYLPSQTPIRDFIHHNTLHAFQQSTFYDAIFKASKIFGYQVTLELDDFRKLYTQDRIKEPILKRMITQQKGEENLEMWLGKLTQKSYDTHNEARIGRIRSHWKTEYQFDLDNAMFPILFRILSNYLDQGISKWHFPGVNKGFLPALRHLEKNSFTSFFKAPRAKKLLLDEATTISSLLNLLVNKEEVHEAYIWDQQFSHHGWSGMICAVEEFPNTLLYPKNISLKDVIIFELLLEIDALDDHFGPHWKPMSEIVDLQSEDLLAPIESTELNEVLKVWQDAFEWSYYDQVLKGLSFSRSQQKSDPLAKSFQAIFCIDERECSIRRHIEHVDAQAETLGCPGFFGVEFYFQPENGKFYEKLCPAPVTPKYLIKESAPSVHRPHDILYSQNTHTALGGLFYSLIMGYWAGIKLFQTIFSPKMSPAISDAFEIMAENSVLSIENTDITKIENELQIGFTIDEMSVRVENLLRGIGLIDHFASIVYLVAHGSSSANNPHHGAHDCGACSGRPGATNARVFAFMANHPKVRQNLAQNGLIIPESTQFVSALHDTASDLMDYYDVSILSKMNLDAHLKNVQQFEQALNLNAKERSRRFASIDTKKEINRVRKAIQDRSVSLFEPRPELGHGTNALCIVGRRALTKDLFLDRRAFMNSYDYSTDLDGNLLLNVMKPLPPVCGGINLEYYFSRVDNQKFGAGTKLPHNVMGLIGVSNSSDGDLRPGLPLQMIEVHDPVRLMIIVEHFPEVILNTIKSQADLFEWFQNEWVHLVSMNPENGEFSYFKNEAFVSYQPITESIPNIHNMQEFIEGAKEMETNHILHATQENLKVHLLKNKS